MTAVDDIRSSLDQYLDWYAARLVQKKQNMHCEKSCYINTENQNRSRELRGGRELLRCCTTNTWHIEVVHGLLTS